MSAADVALPAIDTGAAEPVSAPSSTEDVIVEAPGTPTEAIAPSGGEGDGASRPEPIPGQADGDEPAKPSLDARTLPKDVQKALKAFRESSPENSNAARSLNEAYFRDRATFGDKGLFKDMEEAKITKATLQAIGGSEGIADMQQKIDFLNRLDDDIDRGDPAVLKDMAESSPQGFKQLVPAGLDILRKMDSESYDNAIRPHLVDALEGSGLRETVLSAIEELRAGNGDKANRQLADIARWFQGLKENVERARNAKPDPRLADLTERESRLKQSEEAAFSKNVAGGVISHINSSLENELASLWSGLRLSEEAKSDLAQGVYNEIEKIMREDKAYQANTKALLRSRNYDRTLDYMKAKVDEVAGRAARTVWNRRYGSIPTQAPRPAARPASPTPALAANPSNVPATPNRNAPAEKPLQLAQKPDSKLIDWSRDPNRILFISGRGYLVSGPNKGKLAQWKKV